MIDNASTDHIVLAILLKNKKMFKKYGIKISEKLFKGHKVFDDDQSDQALKILYRFIRKHKTTPATIVELSTYTLLGEDDWSKVEPVFQKIYDFDISSFTPEFMDTSIKDFISYRSVTFSVMDSIDKLQKHEIKNISDLISFVKPFDVQFLEEEMFESINTTKEKDDYIQFLLDGCNRISTGYAGIDYLLDGGWSEKSVNVLTAETNLGKTLVAVALSCGCSKDNKSVLYMTFEQPKNDIQTRFYNNILRMSTKRLQEEIRSNKKFLDGKLGNNNIVIVDNVVGSSISEIEKGIEAYEEKNGKLHMVVIDQLDSITISKGNKIENSYQTYKMITEELKNIAARKNVVMIVLAQTNRKGYKKDTVDTENMADSIGIAQKADNILSLSVHSVIDCGRIIKMTLIKTRVSTKPHHFRFFKMHFATQSIEEITEQEANGNNVENFEQSQKKKSLLPSAIKRKTSSETFF